jgi:DNA-binding transcriptional MerR regulator/methylmalonyl-CoA mutase cobalamin-binding subunit
MLSVGHSIKLVARRTGLSAHVIRVWERRYGVVTPSRTGTNRRRYSDSEVERLELLRRLTEAGHSIGTVATLPTEKLRELAPPATTTGQSRDAAATPVTAGSAEGTGFLDECLSTVKALDARGLEATLDRAAVALGNQGLLLRVIAPLARAIGERWRDGTITSAHEHFASAVIRTFLGHAAKPFAEADGAPVLVVATPAGQLHELGALLVGATAANLGWRVTYLGPALPAAEIAGAARQSRARAVALSLVYPADDPRLDGELTRLRELLPDDVTLLAGGRATPAYRVTLERIGATVVDDLKALAEALDGLRRPLTGTRR